MSSLRSFHTPRRGIAIVMAGVFTLAQLPPYFPVDDAEASHLGSSTASAGTVPPPSVSAVQAFQPDLFTGRATTSIPIVVPPGRKGLQPSLALSYSSSSRNGWLGIGWSLDVGYIERNTKNGVPNYDSTDTYTFLFQGVNSELVQIADGTYRAKQEGLFLRFENRGVSGWEVTDKSGTRYFFGQDVNSQISSSGDIFRWALDKVLDPNGNTLTISYTKDQGQLYLEQIDYTSYEGQTPLVPTNQVRFILESRSDIETTYRSGFAITTAKRLRSIETYATVDSILSLAHRYELSYTASPRTSRSLLGSVTQYGHDGLTALPPVTFTYTQDEPIYLLCTNCVPTLTTGNHGWQIQTHVGMLFPYSEGGNDQKLWPSGYFEPGTKSREEKVCEKVWFWTHCESYTNTVAIPPVPWGSINLTDGGGSGSSNGVSWSVSANGNLYNVSGPQGSHLLAQAWFYSTDSRTLSLSSLSVGGRADVFYVIPGDDVWSPADNKQVPLSPGWTVVAITAYNETDGSLSLNLNTDPFNQLGSGGAMNNTQFAAMHLAGDFNGDAITDVAYTDNGTWRVTLNSPTGFQQEQTWLTGFGSSSDTPLLGDFDADGKTDVALFNAGSWRFATSDGSSFTQQGAWALSLGSGTPLMGDLNGDGLLDIGTYNAGSWTVGLNTGSGFSTSGFSSFSWGTSSEEPLTGDFNGDGLTDVGRVTESSGTIEVAFSTGEEFVAQPGPWITGFGSGQDHTSADFNGDGLSDAVYYDKSSGSVYYAASTAQAFAASQPVVSGIFSLRSTEDTLQVGDYSGDGISDPGVMNFITGQAELAVSSGDPPDLLQSIANGLGGSTTITYGHSSMFDNTGDDETPDLPFSIPVVTQADAADGMGNTYTTTYRYSGGKYDATTREFWGFAKAEVIDALGTVAETNFLQDLHLKGRPWLQQALDIEGHVYTKTENVWSYTEPHPGYEVHFAHLDQTDTFIYDGDASYRQATSRFVYDQYGNLTTTSEDGWTVDKRVDEFGNETFTYPTGDERSTVTTYVYNELDWILNKPSLVQTYDQAGTLMAQRRFIYDNNPDHLTPPTVGDLTQEEEWLDEGDRWLPTTMTYDAYGNVASVTDARRDEACPSGCTTTNTYDPETLTSLTTITNVLSHRRQMTYDSRTGQVTSSTDQNDVTTTTEYDPLGRVLKVIGPTDTTDLPTISYEYDLTTVPIKTTVHARIESGQPEVLTTYTFVDGLGRTIQTRSPAEDPLKQVVTGSVEFGVRGQVAKQWAPYFSSFSETYVPVTQEPGFADLAAASYQYDPVGRISDIIDPDGSTTWIDYDDGETMTSLPNGQTQIQKLLDAYGRLVKVEEVLSESEMYTTTYAYNALNNLTTVTNAVGNMITMTYDSLGRKRTMDDPDMGQWMYFYDDVDNLTSQTDPHPTPGSIHFTYDALNRLTNKESGSIENVCTWNGYGYTCAPDWVPDGQVSVSYTYDNQTKLYAKGKLTEIADGAGSSDFVYDTQGRLTEEERVVEGTPYEITRTYDLLGRLSTLTYPDGDVLHYEYNAQGGLERLYALVFDDPSFRTDYITDIDYNAAGQILRIEYGNGVVSDYTYDPQTLRLDQLVSTAPGGSLQDLTYQFDSVGNVTQISDAVTSNLQDFTYDGLNRLTQAVGNYGTLTYSYDPIGNMTEKDGITMTYGENGAGPHAVTSTADGWTMSYDAGGNLIEKRPPVSDLIAQLFTYDAENRLTKVETAQEESVTITFQPGWNFFSLPVIPQNLSVASVFPYFSQDFEQIAQFEAETGAFQHYVGHAKFDDFGELEYGVGYEVYCKNPNGVTLTFTGQVPTKPLSLEFEPGWHLLAGTNLEAQPLETIFGGLSYDQLLRYDTASGTLVAAIEVTPGEAYFVHVTDWSTWNPPLVRDGTTTFTYDGDGGRLTKTTPEGTTRYIGQLWERAADGQTFIKSIFAGAQRIAIERITITQPLTIEHFWFHGDHLGSSNVVTDEQGYEVQRLSYKPYGEVWSSTGTEDFEHKFTGQRLDPETNLYYFKARYYDPQLGRFIQPDIFIEDVSDPQTLNRYSYARNNPVRYTDPTGHFLLEFLFGLLVSLAFSLITEMVISAFQINGTWAKALRAVNAMVSAGVGGGVAGLTGRVLAINIASAGLTSLTLSTGEGRQFLGSFTEELRDLGLGRQVAGIVASVVTAAAVSSLYFIGLATLTTPKYTGPDYRAKTNQDTLLKDAPEPKADSGQQGGQMAGQIYERIEAGTAIRGDKTWLQQGLVASDTAFQKTPFVGKLFAFLNARHAAFLGSSLQDSAQNAIGSYGFAYISHQAFFTHMISEGVGGIQALLTAAHHGGWAFFLSSALYGAQGTVGMQTIGAYAGQRAASEVLE